MSTLFTQDEGTMNITMNASNPAMSTLALFGASSAPQLGADKPVFSVDISPAGQALFTQDKSTTDAIIPATGMSETLKAALVCMLLS